MLKSEIKPGIIVIVHGVPAKILSCLASSEVLVQVINGAIEQVNVSDLVIVPSGAHVEDGSFSTRLEYASPNEVALARLRFDTFSKYRGRHISLSDALIQTSLSRARFYELYNRFDADAGIESVLRFVRGRQVGIRLLQEKQEEIISKAIKIIYKGKSATYRAVWNEVELACKEQQLDIPCLNTVAKRIKLLDEKKRHQLKHGAESANQLYQAKPGWRETNRPFEIVQMDHTLVDIIVCDEISRKPLGRPWLTILVDVHTRVILGYYLSLHAPSTLSVACAVTHTVMPKKQYLINIGREDVKYPFYGIPEVLHMDNAAEFRTPKLEKACNIYGINPEWRPLGEKHYGGHVERMFGTLMISKVHLLPGSTGSNVVKRRGSNPEKESAMTFKEMLRWFAGQVAIYHTEVHRGIDARPGARWDEYFISEEGNVLLPPVVSDPLRFKLDFMPEETRKIHPYGISIFSHRYYSPLLNPHIGKTDIVIKYDPFSLRKIWAKINGDYIPIPYADHTIPDISFEEYRVAKHTKLPPKSWLSNEEHSSIARRNQSIVMGAVADTKRARKKVAAKAAYFEHNAATFSASAASNQRLNS